MNASQAGISVAIPFRNAERYLLDAIRSVFAQLYEPWELLLLNDGSADGSLAIAEAIADSRVRVFSEAVPRGLSYQLNRATVLAQYPLIARMDADDLMLPTRLKVQAAILAENPEIDIVGTGLYSVRDDLTLVGLRGSESHSFTVEGILGRRQGLHHATVLARRAWHIRNPYDESIRVAQDRELLLRTASVGDLSAISIAAPLYIYRESQNLRREKINAAYRVERNLARRYATSRQQALALRGRALIRARLATIGIASGQAERLQQRRNVAPMTPENVSVFDEGLSAVLQTHVPVASVSDGSR